MSGIVMPGVVAMAARLAGGPLEERILAALAAASWTVYFLGLAREDVITDAGGGSVSQWSDLSGLANHASQATGGARPTYGAAALGGGPGLSFDGGDALVAPAIDLSSHPAAALITVAQDSDTSRTALVSYGTASSTLTGLQLGPNRRVGGTVTVSANGGVNTEVTSVSADLSSPTVVTGTVDWDLSTDEPEVRLDGVNVSGTRHNNNNGTAFGTDDLTIGAVNPSLSFPMTGALSAVVLAAGTGPIAGDVLDAIAEVESLLADALAAGSYE